jgi:pimeloyl-[acyl-carrier protein] methyl ester esterase
MKFYVETRGNGPDLVMLHGWGLHGGLFRPVIDTLSHHFSLHLVDLPGHGRSGMINGDYTLSALAAAVNESVPDNASWLGWSLGARVALQASVDGYPIDKLILVGSNPCFVQKEGWPHAMPEQELLQFAESLNSDYKQTLQRFLAVQSRGSERGREELRALRSDLFAHGEPDPAALAGGLEILRSADLRPLLPKVTQQTLVLHGNRDTLAPLAAAEYTAEQLHNAELKVITGAGHAPFISHPEQFIAAIEAFLHE